MYIALKWLFGMVSAMWIGLCSIDIIYQKQSAHLQFTEFNNLKALGPLLENSSNLIETKSYERTGNEIHPVYQNKSIFLQYTTFVAGACLVLIYYRKNNLLLYPIIKLKAINKHEMKKHLRKIQILKFTAISVGGAILKIFDTSRGIFEQLRIYLITKIYKWQSTPRRSPQNVNLLLLNKLRDFIQEKRNLGHILFAAMQENKYIKMQYQLETLAKKRLVRQIEDSQRQMKENRCRFVNFQQLYLTTHQENNFLKSRVRKLTQDKEEAERNLIKLVNYVWQSKNNDLKAYCSRLIVKNKNNLLNSDVKAEIDQFINKSSKTKPRIRDETKSLDTIKEVNENFHEEDVNVLVKDAPKLRGLPGECVWTVKDKDGFIEKLYEYETDFDNGDTIRRIRQYSVFFDKDCLLDVSSSTTLIQNTNIDLSSLRTQYMNKRITGSQAFQTFLANNKIIFLKRRTQRTPQLAY